MIKIYKYEELENSGIFQRKVDQFDVSEIVSDIIAQVRAEGDNAIRRFSAEFDKVELTSLEMHSDEIDAAYNDFENETKLIDDGILDSFDIVSIVAELCEEYDVTITVDMLEPENFNSAQALYALIESKMDED